MANRTLTNGDRDIPFKGSKDYSLEFILFFLIEALFTISSSMVIGPSEVICSVDWTWISQKNYISSTSEILIRVVNKLEGIGEQRSQQNSLEELWTKNFLNPHSHLGVTVPIVWTQRHLYIIFLQCSLKYKNYRWLLNFF